MPWSADMIAGLVLAAYAAVGLAVVWWQSGRRGVGRQAWLLYVIERIYVGLWFHWRANRRCLFPAAEGGLVIANHRSPVDPLLIWMNHHLGQPDQRIRLIHFLMAREYFSIPGLSWICRTMEAIPVARNGADMAPAKAALKRLRAGDLVGVFPEGRLNPGHDLLPGNSGVAWMALSAGVPVYPVFLHESPTGGDSMVRPFLGFCRVRVTWGEPIDLSRFAGQRRTQQLLQEVTDLIMDRLAELGGVGRQAAKG